MSILQEKKVIIIGDRDGISARTIEECITNEPSAQVIYSATEFFSTVMDLDNQIRIKSLSEKYGPANTLVIIGTGEKESTRLTAQTLTGGDPSGKGVLAGIPLKLNIVHALEDSFMDAVGEVTWEEHLRIFTTLFDTESILRELNEIRK